MSIKFRTITHVIKIMFNSGKNCGEIGKKRLPF